MDGMAMEKRLDYELVRRAKGGDHDAFTMIVDPQIDRFYGLAGLILRDRSQAEDAVQDALLRAWRDLPGLRDLDRFDAWMRRLVVNACRDERRRQQRRRGLVSLGPEHDRAVGAETDALATRDQVERAFRHLNEEQRVVIALRYYLDLPTADAASALGMRHGTYRSKLHRALAALATAMEPEVTAIGQMQGDSQ